MANKTPYEIRLEILHMANEYLNNHFNTNLEFAREAFSRAVEANVAAADEWKKYVPAQYSIDEIMKKATELYSFVSKKD